MKKEIEDRLVKLCIEISKILKSLPYNVLTNHIADQLIRSSSSCALNYGEAQSAESRKDFIHKNSIVLKELRETMIGLKIILYSHSKSHSEKVEIVMEECDHLIAIFQKTINTAKSNIR